MIKDPFEKNKGNVSIDTEQLRHDDPNKNDQDDRDQCWY
jgi:hypothetical protein